MRCSRLAEAASLPWGRGRILPAPGIAGYNVSKAGLNALIQSLALELKGTNVTANAVLPSVIDREKVSLPRLSPIASSGWPPRLLPV